MTLNKFPYARSYLSPVYIDPTMQYPDIFLLTIYLRIVHRFSLRFIGVSINGSCGIGMPRNIFLSMSFSHMRSGGSNCEHSNGN